MGNAILLGYGTVGRCTLPLLIESSCFGPREIFVIDKRQEPGCFAPFRTVGVRYLQREITPDNLAQTLGACGHTGDLLINLSVSIQCLALSDWCQNHGVMYIDTAFEPWADNIFGESLAVHERTMYWEHYSSRLYAQKYWSVRGPTALFSHGANPGLVSHFARAALVELAKCLEDGAEVPIPAGQREWATLAQTLGVKVIHISERDSQVMSQPKALNEFVNTWSVFSFIEESCRPAEIGWGTHERRKPPGARRHLAGSKHCLYIPIPSSQLVLRSWVPVGGPIEGLALPHSESITISKYFTLEDEEGIKYRPTVAYCYLPCDAALASIHESRMSGWQLPQQLRVAANEVTDGADELGVLVLGPEQNGWWYGSRLDIHQTRQLVCDSNPTALQVAAGVLAAVMWMKDNDSRGYVESEDLPYAELLEYARPYLGTIISTPTDWTPFKHRRELFGELTADGVGAWEFENFVASSPPIDDVGNTNAD
jgi:homospermidine synthase